MILFGTFQCISMPSHAAASLSPFLSLTRSRAFQIRRQMIDGKSGQRKIKTLIKSVDEASHQYMRLNHDPK